jgi:predicted dehydrogenase
MPNGSGYSGDNIVATLSFADGSIATITYVANGDPSLPKEFFEVFCEGGVARLEDFTTLLLGRRGKKQQHSYKHDKGHANELRLTCDAMAQGSASPIPFNELVEVSAATLAAIESARTGTSVDLNELAAESLSSHFNIDFFRFKALPGSLPTPN